MKYHLSRIKRLGYGYFKPLLAVIYNEKEIHSEKKAELFQLIERYQFIQFRINGFSSSYENSKFYRIAHNIYTKKIKINECIDELTKEMKVTQEEMAKKEYDLIKRKQEADKTMDELKNITGVGEGKAKRYGEEFINLIKRHVEENEIERPEDMRVRTVANKSKLKVSIIQSIDRKVALDDIAVSNGIEFDELLSEIDTIVYSGTKLNIDYFIENVMDEDRAEDIYEYFKESETDSMDDALDELGDEYTEEEIRLVRIKFISEMAN